MKFTTPTLLLTTLLPLLATAQITGGSSLTSALQKCTGNHPHIVDAIKGLCARQNIVTGPDNQDIFFLNNKVTLRITPPQNTNSAGCSPPAWIPSYWCTAQFLEICNSQGFGTKRFGKNGCQEFHIIHSIS